jgi:hypothetical protein
MAKNSKPTSMDECFLIMPISDPDEYSTGHFYRVYQDIFVPACEKAGFRAVRADEVKQANLIHLDVLQRVVESPMAICDLSSRNPNVLFELGIRQAFDKPVVLVQERGTPKVFDIAPLRYTEYRQELKYHEVPEDQEAIAEALRTTHEACTNGDGVNSIVNLLSLSSPAALKDTGDDNTAQLIRLLRDEVGGLRDEVHRLHQVNDITFTVPQARAITPETIESDVTVLRRTIDHARSMADQGGWDEAARMARGAREALAVLYRDYGSALTAEIRQQIRRQIQRAAEIEQRATDPVERKQ